MTKAHFRYLTFDCYGTLIDWRSGIQENLGRAIYGRPPKKDLLRAYVRLEAKREGSYSPYRDVLRETAIAVAAELGRELSEKAAEAFALSVPSWPPFGDTRGALKRFEELGIKRFILSNVDTDLLEETIRRNRLEVDGYVTAEQVHSYKPAPAHWEEFLRRTGARKAEVLHVAQSAFHDILTAGRLGFATAWVNRYGEALPRGASPTFIADSLRSLLPLV